MTPSFEGHASRSFWLTFFTFFVSIARGDSGKGPYRSASPVPAPRDTLVGSEDIATLELRSGRLCFSYQGTAQLLDTGLSTVTAANYLTPAEQAYVRRQLQAPPFAALLEVLQQLLATDAGEMECVTSICTRLSDKPAPRIELHDLSPQLNPWPS